MAEAALYQPVVVTLYPFEQDISLALDILILQDGHHKDGHHQRYRQYDANRIRKPLYEVVNHLFRGKHDGEEGDANHQRCRNDALYKCQRRVYSSLPAILSGSYLLQIAVNYHHAVVDNHTQRYQQRSQRNGINLYAHCQEYGNRGKDGDRDGNHCHACHPKR